MTRKTLLVAVATAFASSAFAFAAATQWQVKDESYAIKFDTRGASGTIKGLKGTVAFDAAELPASTFAVSVDVNTLDTGNSLKNHHAKADDFFDVAHYPLIKFASGKVEKTATGFTSTGLLTIKDVSKPVVIPFTFDPAGAGAGTFKGHFSVNREDYHLKKWGVGEVVELDLVIPVRKA
ncbi:YceI family protein [Hymenobacter caeli]|uniref:Polyisoprenoid-binding protein YceI n=1 Tax=Hymenobacter caeli TaxID=2735894 RepID=A0ABX2FQ54_9BACT|nr:YceI family protein [Hymenobacter caeli]NRT18544.1 polyisoprenoid-binding protein YceI [Hymenobacter caeli]